MRENLLVKLNSCKKGKTSKLWFLNMGLWLGYFEFEIFQAPFAPLATQFLEDVMIDLVSMEELAMKDGTGKIKLNKTK